MTKHPVKRKQLPVLIDADDRAVASSHPIEQAASPFSFRYSYTEISTAGGATRIKTSKTRYENGKLSTESFEAEMDRFQVYDMMTSAQRFMLDQTALFLRTFTSALLPLSKQRNDRD